MMRFTPNAPRRAFNQPPGRENARSFTEFATVRAIVAQVTDKALLLTNESMTVPTWVPRMKLSASSRAAALNAFRSQEVTVQVELQFALDHHLA